MFNTNSRSLDSEITLTLVEQRLAKYLGTSRTAAARDAGVINCKMSPQSDAEIDLDGVGAELAFCRMMNIYPDLSIGARSGGSDCVLAGRTIDVKQTRYKTGHLLAVRKKSVDPCDLYALMIGAFPTYRFAGMATAEQLFAVDNLHDLGRGVGYVLSQDALQKL